MIPPLERDRPTLGFSEENPLLTKRTSDVKVMCCGTMLRCTSSYSSGNHEKLIDHHRVNVMDRVFMQQDKDPKNENKNFILTVYTVYMYIYMNKTLSVGFCSDLSVFQTQLWPDKLCLSNPQNFDKLPVQPNHNSTKF